MSRVKRDKFWHGQITRTYARAVEKLDGQFKSETETVHTFSTLLFSNNRRNKKPNNKRSLSRGDEMAADSGDSGKSTDVQIDGATARNNTA